MDVASKLNISNTKVDETAVQSLFDDGAQGVWDRSYFHSIDRSTGSRPISSAENSPPPLLRNELDPIQLAPDMDVSSEVLELWAWVNTQDSDVRKLVPEETKNYLVQMLKDCHGNNFVQLHILEVALRLGTQYGENARELLSNCPQDSIAHETPRTEEALLALVGVAGVASATGGWAESAVSKQQVQEWLAPQGFMSTDAWWMHYAFRGYTAADGDYEVFEGVAQSLLKRADQNGLVPSPSFPVSSLQDVYFAVRVMNLVAIDPFTVLDAPAVLAMGGSPLASAWGDADLAVWGSTLYSLGLAPSAAESASIVRAAAACASEQIIPANVKYVGACREAHRQFGGTNANVNIDWKDWEGASAETLLTSMYALEEPLPASSAQSTVDALLADLDTLQTSSLAQLLTMTQSSGVSLDSKERDSAWEEIASRRASEPFTELYVRHQSIQQPDFYSTFAVLKAMKESQGL